MNAKRTCLSVAEAAWAPAIPDWIEVLARACDNSTQRKVAEQLGKSHASVSLVINKRYKANLTAIETLVRGRLMLATVDCPVVGDIAIDQCLQNQRFQPTALEQRLFGRACPQCPHRKGA